MKEKNKDSNTRSKQTLKKEEALTCPAWAREHFSEDESEDESGVELPRDCICLIRRILNQKLLLKSGWQLWWRLNQRLLH